MFPEIDQPFHSTPVSSTDSNNVPDRPQKRSRRIRPEAVAEILARHRRSRLDELYTKPVESLEPEEIAQMKEAFLRGL